MPVETITDKELKLTIQTNDQDTFSVPVEGKLDCIILETNQRISIIIESELGYPILLRNEIEGTNYLAPRARVTYPIQKLIDTDQPTRFNLNERLEITIIGPPNTSVNLTFRIS